MRLVGLGAKRVPGTAPFPCFCQFEQLYTVHENNRGRNAVGVYALHQNKTE